MSSPHSQAQARLRTRAMTTVVTQWQETVRVTIELGADSYIVNILAYPGALFNWVTKIDVD